MFGGSRNDRAAPSPLRVAEGKSPLRIEAPSTPAPFRSPTSTSAQAFFGAPLSPIGNPAMLSPGGKNFQTSDTKEGAYQIYREGPGKWIYDQLLEGKARLKDDKATAKVGRQDRGRRCACLPCTDGCAVVDDSCLAATVELHQRIQEEDRPAAGAGEHPPPSQEAWRHVDLDMGMGVADSHCPCLCSAHHP